MALLLFPITSPVLLGAEGGNVRPPLVVLALLALPLVLWNSGRRLIHDQGFRAILLFASVAILTGAAVLFFSPPDSFPGKPGPAALFVKASLSLLGGLSVYVLARERWRSTADVVTDVPWILAGMSLSCFLAILQMLSQGSLSEWRPAIVAISQWFSTAYREAAPLAGRSNGLAYEPAYLAGQMIVVVIPLSLLAAWVGRIRLATVGWLVALIAVGASGSRLGIIAVVVVGALACIWVGLRVRPALGFLGAILGMVALTLALSLQRGNDYVRAPLDALASGSASHEVAPDPSLQHMAKRLGVRPRWSATLAAWEVARAHPWMGCGLGMVPLHMGAYFQEWSREDQEIQRALSPSSHDLPNPFSMIVRIPSELGLLGVLLAGLILIAHRPRSWNSLGGGLAITGGVGLLADLALHASFAMPQTWLLLAALAASSSDD